jgi:hypothetical protein
MVGHVEGIETGIGLFHQGPAGGVQIQFAPPAFHIGNLPEAGDNAADFEPRCEHSAFWNHTEIILPSRPDTLALHRVRPIKSTGSLAASQGIRVARELGGEISYENN